MGRKRPSEIDDDALHAVPLLSKPAAEENIQRQFGASICLPMGSCGGSIGRAVASDSRGPQFKSSIEKTKMKKIWKGMSHFLKKYLPI